MWNWFPRVWIGFLLSANPFGILVTPAPTTTTQQRSKEIVDTLYLPRDTSTRAHHEFERELQNLKKWNPTTVESSTTEGPTKNGMTPLKPPSPQKIQRGGDVFGMTERDVPTWRQNLSLTELNAELDHVPEDLAQYIFWTGDEPSVALAVNDFVQDGIISRDDAIVFLEEIRSNVDSLKDRYLPRSGNVQNGDEHYSMSTGPVGMGRRDGDGYGDGGDEKIKSSLDKFRDEDVGSSHPKSGQEFSLEEIIYYLAKEILSVGLSKEEKEKEKEKEKKKEKGREQGDLAHPSSSDIQKEIIILLNALLEAQRGEESEGEVKKMGHHQIKKTHLNHQTKITTKI